jgi:hypothetical protein
MSKTRLEMLTKKYAALAQRDFRALPINVRPVFTTGSAQGVIDNGGFPFLFECDWPGLDDWHIFADDYDAIGHKKAAAAFRAALVLFPGGRPQRNLKERRKHIFDRLGGLDGELGKLDRPILGKSAVLDRLLTRYIERNGIT